MNKRLIPAFQLIRLKINSLNKNGIKVSQVIKIRPGVNKFNKEYIDRKSVV